MSSIERVEIRCFRYLLKQPLQTVFGAVLSRPALILKLIDTDGAHGWGEIWCNFPQPGAEYRAALANLVLPAALTGLKSGDYKSAFGTVRARLHLLALQAGEAGPADQIAAGVDGALHDLAARKAGVSLSTLLGGAPRPLPAYASGIDGRLADKMIDAARAQGFRAFKLRVGFQGHDPVDAVSMAQNVVSAGDQLMLDANQNWGVGEACEAARRLSEYPLVWLEEPLPVDRPLEEWQAVADAAGPLAIAGGENMRSQAEFDAAISGSVFDVIQPDACKWGGLSDCADVARRALAAGKRYCPHYLGGGVGLAASAHLLAAVGGDGLLEVDVNDNLLRERLAGPMLAFQEGRIVMPTGPGLGYEPDIASVQEFSTAFYTCAVGAG